MRKRALLCELRPHVQEYMTWLSTASMASWVDAMATTVEIINKCITEI